MKKEKIILFLVASGIGLLAAGIIFYFYESSRTIPSTKIKKISTLVPTPTPKPSIYLNINTPTNEEVTDKRILTVSGKTLPDAKVVVLSPIDLSSGISSADGNFSMSVNIDNDQNIIRITAVSASGETVSQTRIVTYSTENF
jgi:hypothetical protein